MNIDTYYENLKNSLIIQKDKDFIINSSDFENQKVTLIDSEIIIKKSRKVYSGYGDSFVDFVNIFLSKEKSIILAIAILHSLFNSYQNKIKIKLTNQYSDINMIYLEPFTKTDDDYGIIYKATKYKHSPFEINENDQKFQFADSYDSKISTCLKLEKEFIDNYNEFKSRNIFQGFGSISGSEKLVDILFNFSLDENRINELTFETDLGFGQLTPGSCEFRIILYNENCKYNPKIRNNLFFI